MSTSEPLLYSTQLPILSVSLLLIHNIHCIPTWFKNHFWNSPVSNELKGTSIPPKMRKNFALQTSWHHSVEMKKRYSLKKIKFEKTKNYQKLPLDFLPEDWLECNTIRTNFLNCLNLVSISKNVVFYAFWAVRIY